MEMKNICEVLKDYLFHLEGLVYLNAPVMPSELQKDHDRTFLALAKLVQSGEVVSISVQGFKFTDKLAAAILSTSIKVGISHVGEDLYWQLGWKPAHEGDETDLDDLFVEPDSLQQLKDIFMYQKLEEQAPQKQIIKKKKI